MLWLASVDGKGGPASRTRGANGFDGLAAELWDDETGPFFARGAAILEVLPLEAGFGGSLALAPGSWASTRLLTEGGQRPRERGRRPKERGRRPVGS